MSKIDLKWHYRQKLVFSMEISRPRKYELLNTKYVTRTHGNMKGLVRILELFCLQIHNYCTQKNQGNNIYRSRQN